jgi:D,D-heptose 1,7-bisphosphate phosphatase
MRVKQAVFLLVDRDHTQFGKCAANAGDPLVEISPGVRVLDVLLDDVARHGFTDIIILANRLDEGIESAYKNAERRGAKIRVCILSTSTGTSGLLLNGRNLLDSWFLVVSGDAFCEFNLRALVTQFDDKFLAHLALCPGRSTRCKGSVELVGATVTMYMDARTVDHSTRSADVGVYLMSRQILDHVSERCSIETDVLPKLAQAGLLGGMHVGPFAYPETSYAFMRSAYRVGVRPAALLDRDGVLNVDIGYAYRVDDLIWVKGAREAVLRLNDAGYYVFVVTNQAGLAYGTYSEDQLVAFHERMQDDLARIGGHVDAFYYCPFHADALVEAYRVSDHPDRKPNPGMILKAFEQWPVNKSLSFLIGDKESDLEAGRRVDLPGYLFKGGDLRLTIEAALSETMARNEG